MCDANGGGSERRNKFRLFSDNNALKSGLKAEYGGKSYFACERREGNFNFQIIFLPPSFHFRLRHQFPNYQHLSYFVSIPSLWWKISILYSKNALKVNFSIVLMSETLWNCNNSSVSIANEAVAKDEKNSERRKKSRKRKIKHLLMM